MVRGVLPPLRLNRFHLDHPGLPVPEIEQCWLVTQFTEPTMELAEDKPRQSPSGSPMCTTDPRDGASYLVFDRKEFHVPGCLRNGFDVVVVARSYTVRVAEPFGNSQQRPLDAMVRQPPLNRCRAAAKAAKCGLPPFGGVADAPIFLHPETLLCNQPYEFLVSTSSEKHEVTGR